MRISVQIFCSLDRLCGRLNPGLAAVAAALFALLLITLWENSLGSQVADDEIAAIEIAVPP